MRNFQQADRKIAANTARLLFGCCMCSTHPASGTKPLGEVSTLA
jgi:hypothetical protein